MVSWKALTAACLVASSSLVSAGDAPKCGEGSNCPKDSPCCNAYGECGTGLNCLGGCDPRYSYKVDACMPMPACKSGTTYFNDTKGVTSVNDYLGDADKDPWTYTGNVLAYDKDHSILLTMKKDSTGTVVASSNYLWYGKIKATMKTSHRQGVVTDFILMSDVKDEIDYEFVGDDLDHAQTNYYFQGYTDYTKMKKADVDNTYENYHTYEVDWTEDHIDWIIDGETVRTVKKSDTYNETTKNYDYPQTPCRLQIGLWPGGASNQGKGTIEWAGGKIDWDSEDIKDHGYYYASLQSVEVQCYDAPQGSKGNGTKSYIYNDSKGMQSNVELSSKDTKLNDDDNTGLDNPKGHTADASQVKSKTKSLANASQVSSKTKSIPNATGSDGKKTAKASATAHGGGNRGDAGNSDSDGSGFSQGGGDSDSDSDSDSGSGSKGGSSDSDSSAKSTTGGNQSSAAPIILASSSFLALVAGAAIVFM